MSPTFVFLCLISQSSVIGFRLKRLEGQVNLRAVPYTPPTSCPKDIIPPMVPDSNSSPDLDSFGNGIFRYRCNYGYVATNKTTGADLPQEFTARCQPMGPAGSLQVEITSGCAVGYCDLTPLRRLQNSELSSTASNVTVGVVVSSKCEPGYSIDGSANGPRSRQFTCQQDLSWSPAVSDSGCMPVTCGTVQPFPDASITSGQSLSEKIFYNSTITYKCSPGYTFKPSLGESTGPSFTMVCSDSGSMVPLNQPSAISPGLCVPLKCPLPAPTYSRADLVGSPTDSVSLGSQIQYVCKMGTFFSNNTNAGSLSTAHPQLSSFRVACIQKSDGTVQFDTDPRAAGCFAEPCPNPPIPPPTARFANNTPTQQFVGDTIRYVCADGYLYRGLSVPANSTVPTIDATCNENKNWVLDEGAFSVCMPGQCDSIANIPGGMLENVNTKSLGSVSDHLQLGAKLQVDCEDGFYSSKNSTDLVLSCNEQGQFVVSGKCVRRCGPLPEVPRNSVPSLSDGSKYTEGDSLLGSVFAKFTCNQGFSLDGKPRDNNSEAKFSCSSNPGVAQFDPAVSVSVCIPISCGYPPSRANSQWVLNSPHQEYQSGESVSYTCTEGMGVFGSSGKVVGTGYQYRCSETGWEADDKTRNECAKIQCPPNVSIGNGQLTGPFKETFNVGDLIGVECSYGYEAVGANNGGITCSNSGDYIPANYATDMCKPVRCPTLPSTVLGANKVGDSVSLRFGEKPVQYSCDPSWGRPTIQVKCLQDKTYQVDGEQCVEPICGSTVGPPLMNVAPMGNATNSIGTLMNARCQNGFTARDNSVQFQVKCVGEARWAAVDPVFSDGCPVTTEQAEVLLVR